MATLCQMGTHLPLDGDPAFPPQKKAEGRGPNFQPICIVPNGCMDQDATWYGGTPRLRRHCIRWGPSCPSPKGAQTLIFGPCPLWPNGWMN